MAGGTAPVSQGRVPQVRDERDGPLELLNAVPGTVHYVPLLVLWKQR